MNELLRVFFEGFKDCKRMIKEFLPDFNTNQLILSIGILEKIVIALAEDTTKEAVDVQVIEASIDDPPLISFEVAMVAEVPKVPVAIQTEAQASQAIEINGLSLCVYLVFFFLFLTCISPP